MNIDTHHLNKVLADVCGKNISTYPFEHVACIDLSNDSQRWFLVGVHEKGVRKEWNPCEDHNQAAEVKAKLREQGYDYGYAWDANEKEHQAHVMKYRGSQYDPPILYKSSYGESELLALALAVENMMEGEG